MKRKLLALAVVVMCLSLTAYGTLAFFTADTTAHNVITSGNVDIELYEWADESKTKPFPEEGIRDVMPGDTVTKIVEVKNTGSADAYIRVKVEKEIELYVEQAGSSVDNPDGILEAPKGNAELLLIDYDDETWDYNETDGCYYYRTALAPNEVTAPLFAGVTFDTKMGNEYQNCTARIKVTAYAVQVANNGATYADAAGWPEE